VCAAMLMFIVPKPRKVLAGKPGSVRILVESVEKSAACQAVHFKKEVTASLSPRVPNGEMGMPIEQRSC